VTPAAGLDADRYTFPPKASRRSVLHAGLALACSFPAAALAQNVKSAGELAVFQIADMSAAQQDVSKDFLNGSRAAWQEINSRGGLRGKKVQHTIIETDGSASSVKNAVQSAYIDPSCLALFGSVGDPLAQIVAQQLAGGNWRMAHIAPCLQSSAYDADGRTFSIFANRLQQVEHALKSLATVGMTEIGAVYAGATELALYRNDIERSAAALKLRVRHFPPSSDLAQVGQQMTSQTPAILLFLGGTPELAQFTNGLEAQSRQRFVVAMADVNLQTLQQMGSGRKTPVIATQVVPVVTSSAPVARNFRDSLARFFDEPPTSQGLAGYIAARVAFELLDSPEGSPTRASLLAASQRVSKLDIGGFQISLTGQQRTSSYVTQSMLTAEGRVVG